MALRFTKAPQVAIGNAIDSAHWNKLADAFNDRFLGGVGDPTYRLHWYIHSLFRGLRYPNDPLWAAEDEWWKFYSHIQPIEYDYPVIAAGLPEGVNVNNPIGHFVFGNERTGRYNEPDTLNYDAATGDGIVLHDALGAPVSDLDHWEIGKYQRGVTDSTGEDLAQANALVAAQDHLRIRMSAGTGMFHAGYGGFLPTPVVTGLCPDGMNPDVTVKFTRLDNETLCTYSTCPGGSGSGSCSNTSKPVLSWVESGKSYLLFHWDGTTTHLLKEDVIEGPYNGSGDDAYLHRRDGDQLSRALNLYVQDFQGTEAERNQSDYIVDDYAFEFQKFFTRQYFLAPAYGTPSGYGAGALDATYTQFDFNSDTPAGYGTTGGGDSYAIHSGFVCAAFIAVGDSLTEAKTFTIEIDGKAFGSVTIDGTTIDKSLWIEFPKRGTVKIRCDKAMGSTEAAYCEIAELLEMMPQNEDAYLVLRLGSANGTGDDGDGRDTITPKDISNDYFRHGMIYNPTRDGLRAEDTNINRNPIYETMRRVCHERTRMAERIDLQGYEVSGGKSILYFRREARGVSGVDIFRGIAPSADAIASGSIRHNVKYIVESGTTGITYNGASVGVGATFTGAKGVAAFTKLNGDEVVKEYDGIISTAGEASTDNRWSMWIGLTGYWPDEASIYKPDGIAGSDIIGWGHDRCSTFSFDWTDPASSEADEILPHVAFQKTSVLARSENPSGYRYLLGTHTPALTSGPSTLIDQANTGDCQSTEDPSDCIGTVGHYKSCQVYVPDYEIESVVMSGSQVKVTLTGRLRHNDTAPASVTNSSAGWDSYLGTETGARSDENGVIEYLRYSLGSGGDCTQRIGDTAPDASTVAGGSNWLDDLKGACFPRFHFTRLIPKVYEDNNTIYEQQDTRVKSDEITWLDLVLRAICEGYVDEESTNELRRYTDQNGTPACYSKRLFDFTYENLMFKANSNRWPRIVPKTERPDNPKMFGPLPTVFTYAEHFNQIARAVNLLTKARLHLPVLMRSRSKQYRNTIGLSVQGDGNCYNGSVWADGVTGPFASTLIATGDWQIDTSNLTLSAWQRTRITDVGGQCAIQTDRFDYEYEFQVIGLSEYSLPDDLKNLVVNDGAVGFAASLLNNTTTHRRVVLNAEEIGWGTIGGSGEGNGPQESYYTIADLPQDWLEEFEGEDRCILVNSGTLTAPHPPPSDHVDTLGFFGEGSDTLYAFTVSNIEAFIKVPYA